MWDGDQMQRRLRADLLEGDNSANISEFLSYQYINEAAANFVFRTNSLTSKQSITTVANQAEYTLSADHLNIYTEVNNRKYIKYNNGGTNSFPEIKNYTDIIHKSSTTSTATPGEFAVIPHPTLGSIITGTTTSAGATTNGEQTLTDSGGGFTDNVNVGDAVHNTGEATTSYGIVISVTSDTAIVTTLFNGTDNDWSSGDSYVIVPQGRLQLILDPAPVSAGHTITVYYSARPAPVYAAYRTFRMQTQFIDEILRDAKSLYEFRNGDYQKGSADKQLAQAGTLNANLNYSQTFGRKGFGVNIRK